MKHYCITRPRVRLFLTLAVFAIGSITVYVLFHDLLFALLVGGTIVPIFLWPIYDYTDDNNTDLDS